MEINKFISTIIIIIITLIVAFLFAVPKYQKSKNLQNNLVQKQAEYNSKLIYYAKISELLLSIESKKDAIKKINIALPPNFYFSPLVYFLQKKGTQAGLIIKSISFSPISKVGPEKRFKNINLAINLSGNYQNFKSFLSLLEKSERLFEVNSISFKSPGASQNLKQTKNQQQVYDFELAVETHTY